MLWHAPRSIIFLKNNGIQSASLVNISVCVGFLSRWTSIIAVKPIHVCSCYHRYFLGLLIHSDSVSDVCINWSNNSNSFLTWQAPTHPWVKYPLYNSSTDFDNVSMVAQHVFYSSLLCSKKKSAAASESDLGSILHAWLLIKILLLIFLFD